MALSQRVRWGLAIALPTAWALGALGVGLWQWVRPLESSFSAASLARSSVALPEPIGGLFDYGGSTAWAPLRLQLEAAIATEYPGVQLRYTQPAGALPGSQTGVRMVLENRATFAQTSHPLSLEDYALADKYGIRLHETRVAIDGIAVVVHPDLEVDGLTVEQLRDIYSGRVRNWQQVGGPDRDIVPLSRPTSVGGTVSFFVEDVLGDRPLSTHVRLVLTSTQAIQTLRAEPGGIYYASAPVVIPQCGVKALSVGREAGRWVNPVRQPAVPPTQCPAQRNRLNLDVLQSQDYPLTRYLYVVTSDRSPEDERIGKAFVELVLSERGQQLVTEAGFVGIRRSSSAAQSS